MLPHLLCMEQDAEVVPAEEIFNEDGLFNLEDADPHWIIRPLVGSMAVAMSDMDWVEGGGWTSKVIAGYEGMPKPIYTYHWSADDPKAPFDIMMHFHEFTFAVDVKKTNETRVCMTNKWGEPSNINEKIEMARGNGWVPLLALKFPGTEKYDFRLYPLTDGGPLGYHEVDMVELGEWLMQGGAQDGPGELHDTYEDMKLLRGLNRIERCDALQALVDRYIENEWNGNAEQAYEYWTGVFSTHEWPVNGPEYGPHNLIPCQDYMVSLDSDPYVPKLKRVSSRYDEILIFRSLGYYMDWARYRGRPEKKPVIIDIDDSSPP